MKISLEKIPEEGIEIKGVERVSLTDGEPVEVRMDLAVNKAGGDVFIRGSINTVVGLECSRCLKDFEGKVDSRLDLVFTSPDNYVGDAKGHEVSREELNVGVLGGDELDIGEIVSEQIILGLPMKPLCSEDCRGICPTCGKDLNSGDCECDTTSIDPRLQVLKEYLKQKKE